MRQTLPILTIAFALSGCSLVVDSSQYTPPGAHEFCSVSECKASGGADHTCNALGVCVDCDVDGDGFAGNACAGLAGQELPWGDCHDGDPSRFPGAFPRCDSMAREACEVPAAFDNNDGLPGIQELGVLPWFTVQGPTAAGTTLETMSFASRDDHSWLIAGVNGSTTNVHAVALPYDQTNLPTVTSATIASAFQNSFTPSAIRLQTVNGNSYAAAYGVYDNGVPTNAIGVFDLYPSGGSLYASSSTIIQSDPTTSIAPTLPVAVAIPNVVYPLLTVGLVGVRDSTVATQRTLVSGRASFTQDSTLTYADGTFAGEFAASGSWVVHAFRNTQNGATDLAFWNPDLDATPTAGVFVIRTYFTGPSECLAKLRIAEVDSSKLYLGYQVTSNCGMSPGNGATNLIQFTCTTVDGCLYGSSTDLRAAPDGSYDMLSLGGLIWTAAEDVDEPTQIRLRAFDPAQPYNPIVDYVALDVDTIEQGSTIEEIRMTGASRQGTTDVSLVVRIKRPSGQMSTHFFDVRGCANP